MALLPLPFMGVYGFGRGPVRQGQGWMVPGPGEVGAPGTDISGLMGAGQDPGLIEGFIEDNPWALSPPVFPEQDAILYGQPIQPPGFTQFRPPVEDMSFQQGMYGSAPRASGNGLINPLALALLSAGAAGLQRSGWQPRKVTVGEGLGAGVQAGLGTYLQAQQMQERSEIAREELATRKMIRQAQEAQLRESTETARRLNTLKAEYDKAVQGGDNEKAKQIARQILIERMRAKGEYIKVGAGEVIYDPVSGQQIFAGPEKETKDTAFQQRVDALTESLTSSGFNAGEAKKLAQGIAAGRYVVSVNPISNERVVVDVANPPKPIAYLPPVAQPTGPPVSAPSAVGLQGLMANIANRLTDAVGMGLAYPEAEDARNALQNLKAQTQTSLQVAVPGRPSVELLKILAPLTVSPGSILQGEEGAKSKLSKTREMLAGEIRRMESDILSNPSSFKPEEITATRLNHSQLRQLLATYDQILNSFGPEGNQRRKELEQILLGQ